MRHNNVLVLFLLASVACGVDIDAIPPIAVATPAGDGGGIDAGRSEGDAEGGDSGPDAHADAPEPLRDAAPTIACAPFVVPPDFETAGNWQLRGNALGVALGGVQVVQLTEDRGAQKGAVWWNAPAAAGLQGFDAKLTFSVVNSGIAADGLALAWVASTAVPGVGDTSGNLGICNGDHKSLEGYAVLVDTYRTGSGVRLVRVSDCSTVAAAGSNVVAPLPAGLIDGKQHTLAVSLRPAAFSVTIDATMVLTAGATAALPSGPVYFGATAATGGFNSKHIAHELAVSTCR